MVGKTQCRLITLGTITLACLMLAGCTKAMAGKAPALYTKPEVMDKVNEEVDKEGIQLVSETSGTNCVTYHFESTERDLSFDVESGAKLVSDEWGWWYWSRYISCEYWDTIFDLYRKEMDALLNTTFGTDCKSSAHNKYTIYCYSKEDVNKFIQTVNKINDDYKTQEGSYHLDGCLRPLGRITITIRDDASGTSYEVGGSGYEINGTQLTEEQIYADITSRLAYHTDTSFFTEEELTEMMWQYSVRVEQFDLLYVNGTDVGYETTGGIVKYDRSKDEYYVRVSELTGENVLSGYLHAFGITPTEYEAGSRSEISDTGKSKSYVTFTSAGHKYEFDYTYQLTNDESTLKVTKDGTPLNCDCYWYNNYVYMNMDSFCEIFDADYSIENNFEIHFISRGSVSGETQLSVFPSLQGYEGEVQTCVENYYNCAIANVADESEKFRETYGLEAESGTITMTNGKFCSVYADKWSVEIKDVDTQTKIYNRTK